MVIAKFVTTTDSKIIAYSTDGTTWTEVSLDTAVKGWSICYGAGKFVAVSE